MRSRSFLYSSFLKRSRSICALNLSSLSRVAGLLGSCENTCCRSDRDASGLAAAASIAAAAASSSFVSRGVCDEARCSYAPLAAIVFLQVFFTFAAAMPGLVASLR